MDDDVAELLLMLLMNAPMEIRGGELAKLADVHARAVAHVQDARGDDDGHADRDR
jgi:hypothetical protein